MPDTKLSVVNKISFIFINGAFVPEVEHSRVTVEPVLWVFVPDGGDEDLLHSLISFCHQISWRTFQLHFFLLLKHRQDDLKNMCCF